MSGWLVESIAPVGASMLMALMVAAGGIVLGRASASLGSAADPFDTRTAASLAERPGLDQYDPRHLLVLCTTDTEVTVCVREET